MMKTITTLLLSWIVTTNLLLAAEKEITINCAAGLQFDVKEVKVKAGTTLKIHFNNPDIMPHNIVITKPNKSKEVADLAMKMGAEGMAKHYVPESDAILANSKLLKKGEKETLSITLKEAGVYPYICTFPGHFIIMKGQIVVE